MQTVQFPCHILQDMLHLKPSWLAVIYDNKPLSLILFSKSHLLVIHKTSKTICTKFIQILQVFFLANKKYPKVRQKALIWTGTLEQHERDPGQQPLVPRAGGWLVACRDYWRPKIGCQSGNEAFSWGCGLVQRARCVLVAERLAWGFLNISSFL